MYTRLLMKYLAYSWTVWDSKAASVKLWYRTFLLLQIHAEKQQFCWIDCGVHCASIQNKTKWMKKSLTFSKKIKKFLLSITHEGAVIRKHLKENGLGNILLQAMSTEQVLYSTKSTKYPRWKKPYTRLFFFCRPDLKDFLHYYPSYIGSFGDDGFEPPTLVH